MKRRLALLIMTLGLLLQVSLLHGKDARTAAPPLTGRRHPLAFGPLLFWQSVNAALTPELAKGQVFAMS